MRTCTCRFVAAGLPMQNEECVLHTEAKYGCDHCNCDDYRPMAAPAPHAAIKGGFFWPRCLCGHAAQDHNKIP